MTTERQTMEAMVLENEVANMTLDSIGEAVLRTNVQGKITYLNRKAEEMTGWNREEARGRPTTDVFRFFRASSAGHTSGTAMQANQSAADCENCTLVRRDGFEYG